VSAVRVGGFVYGEFTMTLDEYDRHRGALNGPTFTIRLVSGGWEYTHVEVRPDFLGDRVTFCCDSTTIFAKRRLIERLDR
jgi:hypothetical protein